MIIALGSTSEDKKRILSETLRREFKIKPKIIGVEVNSGITDQPLDEKTTIRGATNRAREALKKIPHCDFSIGLEGGLSLISNNYFLVCVAVILDKENKKYIGVSSKLCLPKSVSEKIKKGGQFGLIIREFEKENCKDKNILLIIKKLIKRDVSFKEAIVNSYQIYRNKKYY